jgi:hypothetical protein
MSEEVEGIMKGLEITGESPLDTVFSHKGIGMVNISRMEASIAAQDPIWSRCSANGTSTIWSPCWPSATSIGRASRPSPPIRRDAIRDGCGNRATEG